MANLKYILFVLSVPVLLLVVIIYFIALCFVAVVELISGEVRL